MRLRKTVSILVAMALVLPLGLCSFEGTAYAANTENVASVPAAEQESGRYYYNQLPDEAKSLYDAMYNMYTKGILKTGTGDYDLVANGHVTQEQLDGYANGNMTLLTYMGAARDAFYADYPEIFFVDFSYLSMRVTQKSGTYCAYLGPGRGDNYFAAGFTSEQEVQAALTEYENKMDEIVKGADSVTGDDGKQRTQQQIKYVHDHLIRNTSYRMENTCEKENVGHIRTVYGALTKGESLCEGYARAMKAMLDRLNIPCVLVQGGFRSNEDKLEPHMWNYVQVDGKWYGLDATMDDPIPPIPDEDGGNGVDGFERSDYMIVGADVMNRRHVPDGVMSEANFEFAYPELEGDGGMFSEVSENNGLKVSYNGEAIQGGIKVGVYKVSYNGMGVAKTIESGKYILMKETQYIENSKKWIYGRWAYALPDVYPLNDSDTEWTVTVASAQYVEFAVTSQAPGNYKTTEGGSLENLSYNGDPLLFDAHTELLYNQNGTYLPPPYIKKAIPSNTSRIYVGTTHHIKLIYHEDLKLAEGATEAGLKLSIQQPNTSALENSKIENFKWNGTDTIEFDFTPSKMWLDDSINYVFEATGLVGVDSEKVPKSISYTAANRKAVCAYRSRGYFLNLFGRPQLLENSDLSKKDLEQWKTEDGEGVTPEMVNGLTLVVSSPSHAQTDNMNDMIDNKFPEDNVLKSETYNITPITCNKNVLSLGTSVRLSVGFPAGYGPDDEGVTFKAYHFIRNKYGETIGVEEVPCVITRYGLVITCKSFSPFAIAAVEDDGKNVKTSKSVILAHSEGGQITGADGVLTLEKGESKELTIQAEEGSVIDTLVVGGKYQKITNNKSMTVKVNYQDLMDGDIIEAQFVAATVQEKEKQRGEVVVQPTPVPVQIGLSSEKINVQENKRFEINSTISEASGVHTYQWYKNGAALPGKTAKKLVIESATKQDAGQYTLVVTTAAGSASVSATSKICNVTVQEVPNQEERPQVQNPPMVSNLKASSAAVSKVTLKWKKVSGADGYQVFRYNPTTRKFVKIGSTTKNSYTDKKGTAGKAYRYKVKAYKDVGDITYFGKLSQEVKVIVKPKAPVKVSAKRLSKTSVQIYFKPVKYATTHQIYKYDKKTKKYSLSYQVKSKKLYKYNSKKKKWTYVRKVTKTKDGRFGAKLTGLKKEKNQKYYVKVSVSKKGYKTVSSGKSKIVTIK